MKHKLLNTHGCLSLLICNGFLSSLTGCSTWTAIREVPVSMLTIGGAGGSSRSPGLENKNSEAALAYRSALSSRDDAEKLDHFLEAARLSLGGIKSSCTADDWKIYNSAAAEAAVIAHQLSGGNAATVRGQSRFRSVHLVDADSRNFLRQEQIFSANRLAIKRLSDEVKLDGLGGTLVAYSSKESGLYADDPNVPSEGRALPLTSVVTFPGKSSARIEIHDPGLDDKATIDGKRVGLAADFSSPIGVVGSKTGKGNIGLLAMFRPVENEEIRGLSFLEPIDSNQIPVVFIHGLMSLPRVWQDVYLEMIRDEELREKFQFWYYRYPTGYGVGVNAREFRASFRDVMKRYNPGGTKPAMNKAVLIGHSMGGLVTSASIRSSGDAFWSELMKQSDGGRNIDPDTLAHFKSVAFFDALPQVSRALFLATPHRGSELASGSPGMLGVSLIQLPGRVISGVTETANPDATGASGILQRKSSIEHMRPDSWELKTLVELPVDSRVTTHSIVGMHKEKALKDSSDGVVPYWSSHIDGVASELAVRSDHSVPGNDEAIQEVKRILHLHLDELGR